MGENPPRRNLSGRKNEGPIRISLHSPLFLFNALAFPSILSKSLKFHPVVFSIPTAPPNMSLLDKDLWPAGVLTVLYNVRSSLSGYANNVFWKDFLSAHRAPTCAPLSVRSHHRTDRRTVRSPDKGTNERSKLVWMPRGHTKALADWDKGQNKDCPQRCQIRSSGHCGLCCTE